VTEADFSRFYPAFMPGILGILEQGGGQGQGGAAAASGGLSSRLRGKALQCVGMIGSAVGLEVFREDAVKVLQLLMPAMQISPGATSFPDGYFDYLAPACAQIAKALKEHFVQFLPVVVPPLLRTLSVEVECSVTECASAEEATHGVSHDEESGLQSTVLEVKGRGAMKVTMNTTAVLEKQQAAKTLYEYVDSLGCLMVEFVEPSAHALLPLVVFRYSEDVRNSASFALGRLFGSACEVVRSGAKPTAFAQQFLSPVVQTLVAGLKGELHADPRCCMAEALRDVLQACFESGGKDETSGSQLAPLVALSSQECSSAMVVVLEVATASVQRRSEKMAAFSASEELEAEEDQERLEEELEEEDELMTNLVDCLGYMLKTLATTPAAAASGGAASSVALFDSLVLPLFAQFLGPDQPSSLRHNAVCLFDDMLEFGGAAAHKYIPAVLPVLVAALDDDEESFLQQASVYGLMQIAKNAPQHFSAVHATVTPKLIALVQRPKDDDNELVTENCVSALGTIASVAFAGEQQAQLLQLWLANLPLTADEVEAKVVHRQLCDLIEQGHPAIVGDGFQRLPAVLGVFGRLLEAAEGEAPGCPEALLDARTRDRIVALTKQIQQQVPAAQVQGAFEALSAEQQGAVQRALSA